MFIYLLLFMLIKDLINLLKGGIALSIKLLKDIADFLSRYY